MARGRRRAERVDQGLDGVYFTCSIIAILN